MSDIHVVVLAAGKGTRMKSERAKVLHRIAGLTLIEHVLHASAPLAPRSRVVIIGHQADMVRETLRGWDGVSFAVQEPQLGTGHALLQAEPALRGASGTLVLLYGDVPLLRPATLERLVTHHRMHQAAATVLTAIVDRPDGYGRIVRDGGAIRAIVEHRDASTAERDIREINSGIYAFALEHVFEALHSVGTDNAQREYYLPDVVRIFRARGLVVETVVVDDAQEILGVNSRIELAEVNAVLRDRKNQALMDAGVTILDPSTTWVEEAVEVGAETVIHPGVQLEGRTRIGKGCHIRANVRISDSELGDGVVVNDFCVITGSSIGSGARVGPFAHIRPQSSVGEGAHIGNFVELKKTTLGSRSKANHLAYLGDATIGANVNVGAGTITCNYDGVAKHPTVIDDGAFIGSDSQLIAPVRVGKGAYVAAGSSITDDVPAESLAIARGKQVNKEGWAARRRSAKNHD
jgi:bifunctional UDP-N-acetylglucosamine pyrophosphorylase / glucosamine-1-phosphate N-acetyltransferase